MVRQCSANVNGSIVWRLGEARRGAARSLRREVRDLPEAVFSRWRLAAYATILTDVPAFLPFVSSLPR